MTRVNWSATILAPLRIADERRAIQNNTPLLRKSHVNVWMARETPQFSRNGAGAEKG